MIYATIILVAWNLFSLLEGFREAFYFHNRMNNNSGNRDKYEIHPYFAAERSIFLIVAALTLVQNYSMWMSSSMILSMMCIFPFLHDGMYYRYRNVLDKRLYSKRWWDQSTTSTAVLTRFFNPLSRTLFFVIGTIAYVILIFN